MAGVLEDMVEILVGGISGLGEGIASGVISFVEDIFVVKTTTGTGDSATTTYSLTTFGGLVCIFAGLALAIGLTRLIMNYITSLGR